MANFNISNLISFESWEALQKSVGSWEEFVSTVKPWQNSLKQLSALDAEISKSLIGKLNLSILDSMILTLGIVCLILVVIFKITPKNKLLRLTGPQVPSFLLAIFLTNMYVLPGPSAPLYRFTFSILLPISLGLILMSIDIRSVIKSLGPKPFALSLLACIGTFVGALTFPSLFYFMASPEKIKAMAVVIGNGTGGTENSLAIAHALNLDPSTTSAVIALIMIPYTGVALFNFAVAGSPRLQNRLNAWLKPTMSAEKDFSDIAHGGEENKFTPITMLAAFGIAFVLLPMSDKIFRYIPAIPLFLGGSLKIPMIIVLTTAALILGTYSKFIKSIPHMHTLGMALLWLAVMANFLSANLIKAMSTVSLLAPIAVCYLISVIVTLLGAKFLKLDALTAVIASMAAIGGAASAPMVPLIAERPRLVPLAILMSLVGYAVGNYMGWIYGQFFLRMLFDVAI
ncbi:MAG: DUF819 family protein [Synergistaceae bacterium]|nr:DUF819 family protein [Synergistaceae bacterium]